MSTNHKLFSQLFETVFAEASTSMQMFSSPGAQRVLKFIHKNYSLGHDIDFQFKGKKPTWSDLKERKGRWLFIKGPEGFAAATSTAGKYPQYIVILGKNDVDPDTGEVLVTKNFNAIPVAVDYVKKALGGIDEYNYSDSYYSTSLSGRRKNAADIAAMKGGATNVTVDYLVNKFRPLFARLLVAAKADIRGVISNLAKHDAYEHIKKKAQMLGYVDQAIQELEQGGEIPGYIKTIVKNAVIMTASYYYPGDTGKISKAYNYNSPVTGYAPESEDGVKQVLRDIGEGDKTKLGTVLAFMKRGFLA